MYLAPLEEIFFSWMSPLLLQGYRRPITEKDVWKLDIWDWTETLNDRCACFGGEIGNDVSQFVGPLLLNSLLQCAVAPVMHSADDNVVSWRILSLTRCFKKIPFERVDKNSPFKVSQGKHFTHNILSPGFFKGLSCSVAWGCLSSVGCKLCLVAMILLYQRLGVASLIGSLMLVLLFPIQCLIFSFLPLEDIHFDFVRLVRTTYVMHGRRASSPRFRVFGLNSCHGSGEDNFKERTISVLFTTCNMFLLNSIPVVVTVVSFGVFTLLGGNLTPSRAFTSLSLFAVLRFPLFMLPNIITQCVKIMCTSSPDFNEMQSCYSSVAQLQRKSEAEKPTLSYINLDVPVGQSVAIIGSTVEGKTSLISAMLGEIPPISDASAVIRGMVAYVPQVSWIFNATVCDSILFGSPFEAARYKKAINVTALQHDLDLLPGGDLTEIGERGVNVSGGQKQRVSMARAVYSNLDVYIFYDPLSALDAHVGGQSKDAFKFESTFLFLDKGKKTLRTFKTIVRIQAIFRGRRLRMSIQALARVQPRVRAQVVGMTVS
ncbi:ABC transporter-like, ATP-binding domain [Dillenia turbinata]|uniref:ABC transporter-like, ATP-binding domain n=1 Tax=Dillenia turbinata TaxID=194707 RepID=A0AAN8UKE1_9MAGN